MCLGNDIVYLPTISKRAVRLNERYLHKIFLRSEIEKIHAAVDPVRQIATYWAIKESACKWLLRCGMDRSFNPKRFHILEHIVRYGQESFHHKVEWKEDYVFASLFSPDDVRLQHTILDLRQYKSKEHTDYWKLFIIELAVKTKSQFADWKLEYDKNACPFLVYIPKNTKLPVSCSHDGPYRAFTYYLNISQSI